MHACDALLDPVAVHCEISRYRGLRWAASPQGTGPTSIVMSPLKVDSSRRPPPAPATPSIERLPCSKTVTSPARPPWPTTMGMAERRPPLKDSVSSSNPVPSGTVRWMPPECDSNS